MDLTATGLTAADLTVTDLIGAGVDVDAEAAPRMPEQLWRGGRLDLLLEHARSMPRDPALVGLSDAALEEGLRTGAAAIAAATARWLELLAEWVVRGGWAAAGCSTPATWLSWACGVAPTTARDQVRVALRLRELPLVQERFAAGRISYSKVRAITRAAGEHTEELLLRWADAATAAELERIVADAGRVRDASAAPQVRTDLGVTMRSRADGTFELVWRADGVDGIDVEQLLDRLVATGFAPEAEAADRVPLAVRRADALLGALAAAVAAGPDDASGLDRHLTVVEVSAAVHAAAVGTHPPLDDTTEADDGPTDSAESPAGPSPAASSAVAVRMGRSGRVRPVPLRQLGRLVCATRVEVRTDGSSPADLGRVARLPDVRLRRLLAARDRSCRFPGCGATRWLHAHHVTHWDDGGATDLDNLVLLCGHHHRFVHNAGWRLRPAGPGRWTFHPPVADAPPHPAARPLPGTGSAESPPRPALDPADAAVLLAARVHGRSLDLPPDALTPLHWDGTGYDHDLTVAVLLDRLAAAA